MRLPALSLLSLRQDLAYSGDDPFPLFWLLVFCTFILRGGGGTVLFLSSLLGYPLLNFSLLFD